MRALLSTLFFGSALAIAATAQAQVAPAPTSGPADTEKVRQVFVYGDDPCPTGKGDEIVICGRLPDNDRYRIPKELRTDPNSPQVQAWANRASSFERVGAAGIDSCSPVGAGGFTGCFSQLARAAKEERKAMMGSATWADAIAKARAQRLGNLDAESAAIEAQAKADEAEAARLKAAQEAESAADKEANPVPK